MEKIEWGKINEISVEYRNYMASTLKKTILIIRENIISPKEIEEYERDLQKNDSYKDSYAENFLYRNALLLTKSHIHLIAVKHANDMNNLHSLAIHVRVILECAGQIMRSYYNLSMGKSREFRKSLELRAVGAEYRSVMNHLTLHISTSQGKKKHLATTKKHLEEYLADVLPDIKIKPSEIKWPYSETVEHLERGKYWYNYISDCFFHSKIKNLKSDPYKGGFFANNRPNDIFVFSLLLDYLVEQSLIMIALCQSNTPAFHEVSKMLKSQREMSAFYKEKIEQCLPR